TVNPDTGVVSFDQLNAIWHGDSVNPDDVETLTMASAGDLLIRATVTDADGDADTADVNLGAGVFSVRDDGPSSFAPMSSIVANAASGASVASLDVFGNTGADGLGGTVFVGTDGAQLFQTDGSTAVTSGGESLFMTGFGTNVLNVETAGGTSVMTITLNPNADQESDDLYTVEVHQKIDDGSGFIFDDFSAAPAGNNQWIGLDSDGGDIMADINDSEDLLITAPGDEVNTSSADLGVANQWTDGGESLRLDFVTDLRRDGASDEMDFQGYTYDGHYMVSNFSMKMVQVQGSGSSAVGFRIYNFDDTLPNKKDLAAGSTSVAIIAASVVVTAADGVTPVNPSNYDVIMDGATNTLYVSGLEQGQTVSFDGASTFEAVEIINVNGESNPEGGNFSGYQPFGAGGFGYDSPVAGNDVPMEFDIALEDGDGDSVPGTIGLTVTPNDGVIMGTAGDDALGGANTDDTLIGGDGNDILTGGDGDDIFLWQENDADGGTTENPIIDTITDFNVSGNDTLDLSDLLVGEHDGTGMNADNLVDYLNFTSDGTDTVVHIAPAGDGNVTQEIILQDVDLTSGGTLSNQDIIDTLVASNNLNTDS
ncbi:MAG: type I secretion C-terminal target domain-containing protein, partial [Oceanospirillaceae bacterium]|nr:type I secretion C-terminal target domain-containing protein [Oceanospirillaceae bacterium]